ncbi:hypothetical protein D3C87_1748110 [compost metagenome]
MIVHRGQIDAGRTRDLAHRRAVVALLRKERLGRVQDGIAGVGSSDFLHKVEFKRLFKSIMR